VTEARIALVGDFSERHVAHRAIPRALELARERAGIEVSWEWVATRRIGDAHRDLAGYSAVWLVPASPYENTQGALDAVRWARETGRPFLGTCGGFQHMVLEIARNVAGIRDADHAETNPGGSKPVVTPLSCSLVEKTGIVHFSPGSILAMAYGCLEATGGYHCNYGVNPAFRAALEAAGLIFTSWDDAKDIRGAELASHPFFAGVLFQPERAALRGEAPPLIVAFARASASPA
jgi:CTP synthase (UTP-ammonia lyase)